MVVDYTVRVTEDSQMKLISLTVVSALCLATSMFGAVAPPNPTPEPGTILLLGGGLLALGGAAWRKNRKK
jgi:hypothetical protein